MQSELERLWKLAFGYHRQGQWEAEAECYRKSVEICREADDPIGEAQALINLGAVYSEQDRLVDAEACYQKSVEIYREAGDRVYEGALLTNVGLLRAMQEDVAGGLAIARQPPRTRGWRRRGVRRSWRGPGGWSRIWRRRGERKEERCA